MINVHEIIMATSDKSEVRKKTEMIKRGEIIL